MADENEDAPAEESDAWRSPPGPALEYYLALAEAHEIEAAARRFDALEAAMDVE